MSEDIDPTPEPTPAPEPATDPTPEPVPDVEPAPHVSSWDMLKASLPDELSGSTTLNGVESFGDYVKWGDNVSGMIGRKGILPPNTDDPDDVNRYYTDLGRPETAADYDLGEFEVPEGLPWDNELQGRMLEKLHASGITNDQAKDIMGSFLEEQTAGWEKLQELGPQGQERGMTELKEAWGDKFDANLDLGMRAFSQLAGDDAKALSETKLADGTNLGDSAQFAKVFANAGKFMTEHPLQGSKLTPARGHTPAEAEAAIHAFRNSPETQKILKDPTHPGRKAALRQLEQLYMAATPEDKTIDAA